MENILFSIGNDAKAKRAKNYDMTWREFTAEMHDYIDEPSIGVEFTGSETEDQYARKKKRQNYIAAAVDKVRSNDTVLGRSLIFIDLDGVSTRKVRQVTRALEDKGFAYFAHGTSGDRHELKGGEDVRAVRFLIPTNRPMDADEIWTVQHSLLNDLGIIDTKGVDMTACQRARIMFTPPYDAEWWENDGKPVSVMRMMNNGYEPPSESGNTNWSDEALANASENSQAIAGWAFEMGLETLTSGRGWALQCPNHMAHSDNDGTDGSTAILLPDALHPEVRFQCQHEHCKGLNSHQHLMLSLAGVPDQYLPEAHNISKKQIAELLPFMDDEEVAYQYERETGAAAEGLEAHQCTDEDLMDAPNDLFTKRDPIIDGIINFKSTWYLAGESNIGKSFYVLGQMACVASGIPFAGAPVIRAHCFYFDAEGGSTSIDRKQALQKTYGDDLDWLHIVDLQAEGWDITSKAGRRAILRHIRSIAQTDPVGIVAFDSLNQTVALRDEGARPFDENNPSDMGEIVKALKTIAEATGGSAGVVHHPAKSDKNAKRTGRGSGALHGAVDYAYFIEQPDETKPLQLNFYMEKARVSVKQTPRGFILSKCKIEIAASHNEEVLSLQSTREALDFSDILKGYTLKPFDASPRDETLVLIPVALAPFENAAATAGRSAVRLTEAGEAAVAAQLKGDEKAIYNALESLQDVDDRTNGYTAAEIIKVAGAGGKRRPAIQSLIDRKLLTYGRDDRGNLLNGINGRHTQYRVPTSPKDFDAISPSCIEGDLDDD